jgi:hypothetical protein
LQLLRQVPSKAVVSTFIRSQVLLGALAEFLPTTGAVFPVRPQLTAMAAVPPNAGHTSPSQLRAQSTSMAQVKLNAAFPRVVPQQ